MGALLLLAGPAAAQAAGASFSVEAFASAALLVFFTVFLAILARTLLARPKDLSAASRLPLEDDAREIRP